MVIFVDDVPGTRTRSDMVEVAVDHGPAASYTGLRQALSALRQAGASFGDLPIRHAAEWRELFPAEVTDTTRLEEIALAPSERRLHRESEQVYRVLSVAAAALCIGAAGLGKPVALHGVGGTDLTSLRGFMRAVEHASVFPGAEFVLLAQTSVRAPIGAHDDFREDRVRCLRRMGLAVTLDDLVPDLADRGPSGLESEESQLFTRAVDPEGSRLDRIAAALAYSRRAFFTTNWEGMAVVAGGAIDLIGGITDADVPELLAKAERQDELVGAIEFEPAILRGSADVHAYLLKVLGIQASFRGNQDAALNYFRAMRENGSGLNPEMCAQSHLFSALTLSKRKLQLADAVAELEQGFEAVAEQPGESDSIRRERGWLHNLRGMTFFAARKLGSAFEHEKKALACLDGLNDASSAHLRINLYSNISVLQEKADKHESALQTWDKFKQASGASSTGFVKHHSYRSGGIRLVVGERETALVELNTTLACAAEFHDDFHTFEVNLELGTLHAKASENDDAAQHFENAESAARRIGDPFRIARAMAGRAQLSGSAELAPQIAEMASLSLTSPGPAETLAKTVTEGSDVLSLLPTPRTKLNRPFDLINFQD